MSSPKARRRQRSTRVVAAAALVLTAAVVVIGAVLSASLTVVSVAAVLAVLLGAGAVRITHSALVLARREAAADRARQAQGYRTITEQRVREHGAFVDAVQGRIGSAERAAEELESAVVASQARAAAAMRRLSEELRRADLAEADGTRLAVVLEESEERAAEAVVRIAELEDENGVLRTENAVLKSELDAQAWPRARQA
jgi:hypothetical protein